MGFPIVLLHGAWHGPWCWEALVPLLEAKGHPVLAPQLPCDPGQTEKAIKLKLYQTLVLEAVQGLREPFLILGHSLAGILLLQLAERIPQKIREMVFLSAYIPKPGQCLLDIAQRDRAADMGPAFESGGDSKILSLRPELAPEFLCQDASEQQQSRFAAQLVPQSLRPMIETVRYDLDAVCQVPRRYLACRDDRALSLSCQMEMAENLQAPITILDGSHSLFWTQPEVLASQILQLNRLGEV